MIQRRRTRNRHEKTRLAFWRVVSADDRHLGFARAGAGEAGKSAGRRGDKLDGLSRAVYRQRSRLLSEAGRRGRAYSDAPNIAVAALLSGDIDYIELIGSAIRSAARGLPIRAISTSIKSPFFSVIAQNKFKSVKDLKGATIGIASIGGTNHISTRLTLKEFGLDPEKDVKLIAIGDEKLIYDAFKIGRTDAVVLAPPYSIQLKREGFPILANTAQYVTIPFSGLGTTLDRIKSNRAQIKKLLKAEIEALRYLRDNPAGTVEVIRKRFSMDDKTAQESYDVVVDAFSRDGRVPLDGVDILLQIEKDQKLIQPLSHPKWSSTHR